MHPRWSVIRRRSAIGRVRYRRFHCIGGPIRSDKGALTLFSDAFVKSVCRTNLTISSVYFVIYFRVEVIAVI